MPKIEPRKMTHDNPNEIIVFLIGMRINRLRAVRQWWPVFTAMPRMLRELRAEPESGLLGARSALSGRTIFTVQYWRSTAELEHYAGNPDQRHRPAWAAYNQAAKDNDAVGVFHETYLVTAQNQESLYRNMPRSGLAAATQWIPISERRDRFRERLSAPADGDRSR